MTGRRWWRTRTAKREAVGRPDPRPDETVVARTIPVDPYGEAPTCLCREGADGMGTSTWAPLDFNVETPDHSAVVSWSADTQHLLCWVCGLVVLQVPEARQATVADALTWTNAAREQVFRVGRRRAPWSVLHAWDVVARLTAWQIAPGGEERCPVTTPAGVASS